MRWDGPGLPLKILPRDGTGQDSLSKSGAGHGTGRGTGGGTGRGTGCGTGRGTGRRTGSGKGRRMGQDGTGQDRINAIFCCLLFFCFRTSSVFCLVWKIILSWDILGQRDKLKILPWDGTGRDSLSKLCHGTGWAGTASKNPGRDVGRDKEIFFVQRDKGTTRCTIPDCSGTPHGTSCTLETLIQSHCTGDPRSSIP